MTSCWTSFSISSMRATSKRALSLMAARASSGHDAALDEDLGRRDLHLEPGGEAVLVGPEPGHLGARVAGDHDGDLTGVRQA